MSQKIKNYQDLFCLLTLIRYLTQCHGNFINKTLVYYNFGPSIRKWINLFQSGAESCIIQNGYMSESFFLRRGCRQGDPISSLYIYFVCRNFGEND